MPGFQRSVFDDFLDRQVLITNGKSFYGRVAGTTQWNDDGTQRQAAIAELRSCDELQLVPEPDNPHDANAVRVLSPTGKQIGYLEARLAGETVRRTHKGITTRAFVSNLSGGRAGQSLGVVLGLVIYSS